MTDKELRRIFQKGECLTLDAMRLYNEKKLNKKSMHEVEKHLLECGLCAAAVDGLNPKRLNEVNKLAEHIQRRLSVYMNTPPQVPFFRRFGFAIISAFLLFVGGCSLWYFSQEKKNNPAKVADSVLINANNIPPNGNGNLNNVQPVVYENSNSSSVTNNLVEDNKDNKKVISSKMQNLPADLPGQPKTLTVGQDANQKAVDNKSSNATNPIDGPTTKNADANEPIHIKSIQIYPPITLNEKTTRKESKDGQLGRSESSEAAFQLDEMPSYPGGDVALKSFILNSFKPMTVDREKITKYATGIRFNVNSKTGEITSPELSMNLSPDIDAEILRVINAMPYWNPGKKKGEVQIMIGITFE